ncbi:hypothetical protein ACQKFO_08895 [Rossellomorea sp. NPDC071047]|uniref:hypothetical protein n=1 Tax=Rossellomorea sp. NPDC071047 TaxID=3390675 RepID=UPI003CFF98DC
MANILRYNLYLLVLYSIIFYFSISRLNLFGRLTPFINLFTILVLLGLGIYYPRFSKGISEEMVSRIKLIWRTSFLVLLFVVQMTMHVINNSILYVIVIITMVLIVMDFWRGRGHSSK